MRAFSTAASVARHSIGVAAEALLIAAIIAALALALAPVYKPASFVAGADTAAAARPPRAVITVPDGVFAGTTTATLNPGGTGVWAYAECYQGTTLVLRQWREGNSEGKATFQLGPTDPWQSGDAECRAEEGSWDRSGRWRMVASTTFHVDA